MKLEGVREKVFLDRYSLKDKEGAPIEKTPDEMWRRVAHGLSLQEKPALRKGWEKKFYNAMDGFKFLPGGRILAGAGTGYDVTYFNCFVIPSPKDSRNGILDNLKIMIEIMARGGGVGINLSSLRPKGARVKKVNGFSSGPMNWAELYSLATKDIVQQGGSRRGALMLMLHDWHPDIEEFITVKQDLSRINGANLSVCVSDDFMEAVKKGADWNLEFPDLDDPTYDKKWDGDLNIWKKNGGKTKIMKTVKAKYLWDLICKAAWQSAEPGLHFLDRSNKRSNTWYFEQLIATNPCVTADTWINTNKGSFQVSDLIGKQFIARVDGRDIFSGEKGFFKTGTKQVVLLQTKEGYSLRLTADHRVKKISRLTRYTKETEWSEVSKLKKGDFVVLNNHRNNSFWKGKYTKGDGYLLGMLLGDGTLKEDKAILSVWLPQVSRTALTLSGPQAVMSRAYQISMEVPHRKDFKGWMSIKNRGESRLSLAYIKQLAESVGMKPGSKIITKEIEEGSSDFYKGFLKGLFDTDGSVQGTQEKGVSIRLSQSNIFTLEAVQRMLLRLGIVSTIYKNRREEGKKSLPNGKGGMKDYFVKAQHELVISQDNLLSFADLIGFEDLEKINKLTTLLGQYRRKLNEEKFFAEVTSVSLNGVEDVYDVQIPGLQAFDANGLYAHNCGEQPLGPWAVCNLGAMNLSAYIIAGEFDYKNFTRDVRIAMRFMDNVIDDTYYFYPENEKIAKDIRRTGLGILGLGDALIKMKLPYGSDESLPVIKKIFETLRNSAYDESAEIAKEKGSFPKYNKEKYLQGWHIQALPKEIREKISKYGIRNAVLLTIAPTGTTSLISGVSSGIEPVYEFEFIRKDRLGEHRMYHPLYEQWKKDHPQDERPNYFVSANDLTPEEHIRVQAIAQEYIDSSISKTVNAPNGHTVEDVERLYMMAYDNGLKGITYMRDGSREGVLSRIDDKKTEPLAAPVVLQAPKTPRPMMVEGVTYQTETPVGKTYITINHNQNGDPIEVFITIGKSGSDVAAMADALGRMISLNLRLYGTLAPRERVRQIVSELTGIGGARSTGFGENRVRSLPDAVAKVLARHYNFKVNGVDEDKFPAAHGMSQGAMTIGHPSGISSGNSEEVKVPQAAKEEPVVLAAQLPLQEQNQGAAAGTAQAASESTATNLYDICPACGAGALAYEEGCRKCYACGHSEC